MCFRYLLFGEEQYLTMFVKKYVSAMRYMKLAGTHQGFSWLIDVWPMACRHSSVLAIR